MVYKNFVKLIQTFLHESQTHKVIQLSEISFVHKLKFKFQVLCIQSTA